MPRLTILHAEAQRRPRGFWHTATPLWIAGSILLGLAVALLVRH